MAACSTARSENVPARRPANVTSSRPQTPPRGRWPPGKATPRKVIGHSVAQDGSADALQRLELRNSHASILAMTHPALEATAAALETPSGKGAKDENFPVGSWLLPAAAAAARRGVLRLRAGRGRHRRQPRSDAGRQARAPRTPGGGADRPRRARGALCPRRRRCARASPPRASARATPSTCSRPSSATPPSCATTTFRICSATARSRHRRSGAICSICTASRASCTASPIHCATRSSCSITCRTARTTTGRSIGSTCRWTASRPRASGSRRSIGTATSPALRQVLDRVLDGVDELLSTADELPRALRSRRLAAESAVILEIARRLAEELRRRDPLAERVELEPRPLPALRAAGRRAAWHGRGSVRQRPQAGSQRDEPGLRRRSAGAAPAGQPEIGAAEVHVRDVVLGSGTSFYWGMRLLPAAKRKAMYAIYAFCREVDDVADGNAPVAAKLDALAGWRREIDALFAGTSEPADRARAARPDRALRPAGQRVPRHDRRHGDGCRRHACARRRCAT